MMCGWSRGIVCCWLDWILWIPDCVCGFFTILAHSNWKLINNSASNWGGKKKHFIVVICNIKIYLLWKFQHHPLSLLIFFGCTHLWVFYYWGVNLFMAIKFINFSKQRVRWKVGEFYVFVFMSMDCNVGVSFIN